jgi:hypothetical protein
MVQEKPQDKSFLQNIKDSAKNALEAIGDNFRDFTDFIVSLKDLATKRDNKKAKEFFAMVAHLGAVMTRAGVSKPTETKARLGEVAPPLMGPEQSQEQIR